MTRPTAHAPGYSLVEIVIGILLIGIILIGVARSMTQTTVTSFVRHHRTVAQLIAKNEIESLRAAGPAAAGQAIGTDTVRSDNTRASDGAYELTVDTTLACIGGADMDDDSLEAEPIPDGCPDANPVLTYRVTVTHMPRATSRPEAVSVRHQLHLGESGRHAGAYATP